MTGEEMERAIEFLLQSIEALSEHTRSLRETVRALTVNQARCSLAQHPGQVRTSGHFE